MINVAAPKKYPVEVQERAVAMVRELERERGEGHGAIARQVIGVGQVRNRLRRRAVERTVPFGLPCLSLITVWYALHGHAPEDTAANRHGPGGTQGRPNRPTTTWP
jgi:hypothetical protein